MINAVNSVSQVVDATFPIPFASNRICTGCAVRHETGSSRFTLLKPGIYNVSFSAVYSSTVAGIAILAIEIDGEPVVGGHIANTVAVGNTYSGYVSIPVRVYECGSVSVTVNNLSTIPVTLAESAVTIERIC